MRKLLVALILAAVTFTAASGCRTASSSGSSGCSSCGH